MLKPIIEERDEATAGSVERTPSVRWSLASLSLSMLLSSLGTSIANVGLPTLAQAFNSSFHEVQWHRQLTERVARTSPQSATRGVRGGFPEAY